MSKKTTVETARYQAEQNDRLIRFGMDKALTNANTAIEKSKIMQRDESDELSPACIIKELHTNARMARDDGDYASSNRALELIGKSLKMFLTVNVVNNNVNIGHDSATKMLIERGYVINGDIRAPSDDKYD